MKKKKTSDSKEDDWYNAVSSVARQRQKAELAELMTSGSAIRRRQSISIPPDNAVAAVCVVLLWATLCGRRTLCWRAFSTLSRRG